MRSHENNQVSDWVSIVYLTCKRASFILNNIHCSLLAIKASLKFPPITLINQFGSPENKLKETIRPGRVYNINEIQ